jgi:hypothetical protein
VLAPVSGPAPSPGRGRAGGVSSADHHHHSDAHDPSRVEDPTASRFRLAFASRCVASLLIATGLVRADFYAADPSSGDTHRRRDPTLVGSSNRRSQQRRAIRTSRSPHGCGRSLLRHAGPAVPAPTSNTSTSTTVVRSDAPVAVISLPVTHSNSTGSWPRPSPRLDSERLGLGYSPRWGELTRRGPESSPLATNAPPAGRNP